MARYICLLTGGEANRLRTTGKVDCRRHTHVNRRVARMMTLGAQIVPTYVAENWNAIALWATLPCGSASGKHLVMIDADEWRKITEHDSYGGIGFSSMQLVSQARSF